MKKIFKIIGIIAIIAIISFSMACSGVDKAKSKHTMALNTVLNGAGGNDAALGLDGMLSSGLTLNKEFFMKNWKHWTCVGIMAVFVFTFIACTLERIEEYRTETITVGDNKTVFVNTTLFRDEMDKAKNKLTTALNAILNGAGGNDAALGLDGMLSSELTLNLERTSGYSKYQIVSGQTSKLYFLNANHVLKASSDELVMTITSIISGSLLFE